MKGKTVFSVSIREEAFVFTLQIRKLKLKRINHTKFVEDCAFEPDYLIPVSIFVYFIVADLLYIVSFISLTVFFLILTI